MWRLGREEMVRPRRQGPALVGGPSTSPLGAFDSPNALASILRPVAVRLAHLCGAWRVSVFSRVACASTRSRVAFELLYIVGAHRLCYVLPCIRRRLLWSVAAFAGRSIALLGHLHHGAARCCCRARRVLDLCLRPSPSAHWREHAMKAPNLSLKRTARRRRLCAVCSRPLSLVR